MKWLKSKGCWITFAVLMCITCISNYLKKGDIKDLYIASAIILFFAMPVIYKLIAKYREHSAKNSPQAKAVLLALSESPEAAMAAIRALPKVQKAKDKQKAIENVIGRTLPIMVDKILEDGIFSEEEETALLGLLRQANITLENADVICRARLIQASLIRRLLEGKVQPMIKPEDIPFNLQKSEVPIWDFGALHVLRDRVVSQWQGGSQGVSIRIAKGVYYRTSAMRGQRVSQQIRENVGLCNVAVTNKFVYIQGGILGAKRIRHTNVINVDLYSDGVTIYTEREKPLTILTSNAWFLCNCIRNAQNWA